MAVNLDSCHPTSRPLEIPLAALFSPAAGAFDSTGQHSRTPHAHVVHSAVEIRKH